MSLTATADALFLSTHAGGIWKLDCDDSNWVALNADLWDDHADDLTEVDRTLYCGTMGNGVFRFDAATMAWTQSVAGLWQQDVRMMGRQGLTTWAGTYGAGLFALDPVTQTGGAQRRHHGAAYDVRRVDGPGVYAGTVGGGAWRPPTRRHMDAIACRPVPAQRVPAGRHGRSRLRLHVGWCLSFRRSWRHLGSERAFDTRHHGAAGAGRCPVRGHLGRRPLAVHEWRRHLDAPRHRPAGLAPPRCLPLRGGALRGAGRPGRLPPGRWRFDPASVDDGLPGCMRAASPTRKDHSVARLPRRLPHESRHVRLGFRPQPEQHPLPGPTGVGGNYWQAPGILTAPATARLTRRTTASGPWLAIRALAGNG
jgi:hypothetical protein